MSTALKVRLYTYADLLEMPEEARYEIIDGELYDMSPAPGPAHQEFSMELSLQIGNALKGDPCRPFAAPFDVFLDADLTDCMRSTVVVQPDLLVVCEEKKLSEKGCHSAPDLAVEILSPPTSAKDLILKHSMYERWGVPEYWIVDPQYRVVMAYRMEEGGRYAAAQRYESDGVAVSAVIPKIRVDLAMIFPKDRTD